jgi:hypothetical protein
MRVLLIIKETTFWDWKFENAIAGSDECATITAPKMSHMQLMLALE